MSPPNIQARAFFGLKTDVKGNALFVSESDVVYPAGGILVVHNFELKHQRFIKLPDKQKSIQAVTVAPNKKIIALSEAADDHNKKPSLALYDLETLKRKKVMTIPFEGKTCKEFVAVQFTWDSKYLVAITGEPDWILYYYHWENGKIESQVKAQNPNGGGTITQVNCNPTDASLVVITGPFTFRLMNVSETVWRQWGWTKAENMDISSCMWLTPDRVMFGTKTGTLMTVENGELRQNCCYKALDVTVMNMKKTEERPDGGETVSKSEPLQDLLTSMKEEDKHEVRCLVSFKKGFAFSCMDGVVHMFEKESPHKWVKRNVFQITEKEFRTGEHEVKTLDVIQHLSVSPTQEILMATTLKSQLYMVKLFERHMEQEPVISFKELGQMLHHGRINGLSMCSWKPIFMTSGADDRSVRIWNYETEELELVKFYQEDVNSISLHPTGLFAIIGFSDKLRYNVILIDDLHQMREFSIRNCKVCRFSNNGHLFAAVNDSVIQVFSSISFNNVFNLKAHIGTVNSLSWVGSDDKLVSCGSDGAVYEWSMSTAKRVGEIIMKNNDFSDCSVRSDGKSSYVVGVDGEVKEVCNNAVIRNLKIIGCKLDNVVLARSDLMLFVTGGSGNVVSIQFPLLDKAVFAEFHMHNANVTGMSLSYDDQTLITVAEDATMCIWKLTNVEGKVIALDKDFSYSKEILINKKKLQDKRNTINLLSTRIGEMETEHAYQMRHIKSVHADNLRDIHQGYSKAIEELQQKKEDMEAKHTHEMNQINDIIAQMKTQHEREVEHAETNFNEKLIFEYNKCQMLEDKTANLRLTSEKEMEELIKSKNQALRELTDSYEARLNEKNIQIEELKEKMEIEYKEHEYIKCLMEEDADIDIVELKTSYEIQLREEKETNVRLTGERNVLKTKINTYLKEIEDSKHTAKQLAAEHGKFQNVIRKMEEDVTDLKKEVSERDGTIQEKVKQNSELKIKNQQLEKFKFILNFKINELKSQIDPKDSEIEELKIQIGEMEADTTKLLEDKHQCEFKIGVLKEKLTAANKEIKKELDAITSLKNLIKKMKADVFNIVSQLQDPYKLRNAVQGIMQKKYMAREEAGELRFKEKSTEQEVAEEFGRQRLHLEERIASLEQQLATQTANCKTQLNNTSKENSSLMRKVEELTKSLNETVSESVKLKSLLGLGGKQMSPSEARFAIEKASQDYDKLEKHYKSIAEDQENRIQALIEENIILAAKCGYDKRSESGTK